MKKGVYWVVMCADGHGWDYVYDGLWGYETRIYSTKKGAERHMRKLRNDKCWRDTNPRCDQDDERYDPKYDWRQDIPEFHVKQMTVEEIEAAGGALLQDLEKTARGGNYEPQTKNNPSLRILRGAAERT